MENEKIDIKWELCKIKICLDDSPSNPHFEDNRKFGLKRLKVLQNHFENNYEDKIREDFIKLLNYYTGIIDYDEHGIIVDEWLDIIKNK